MWRLVLTVSLLCCSSEGSVTCKDENGKDVDWYILYKTPKNQNKKLDGLDYVYIYPDVNDNNKAKSLKKIRKINDATGILANTLQPLFCFDKNNPQATPNFGFISYNDQPPDCTEHSSFGHSKGVVMVQKDNNGGKGVWLLHSTPQFPYDRKPDNFWPKSGARNGQTFICVTFPYTAFKDIGKHLQYIKAFPFDHHIPKDFYEELQQPEPGKRAKGISIPPGNFQLLTSIGGKEFHSIAKQVSPKDKGKPEDGDLYVSISKAVNSDVNVQTWGCQKGRDESFCSGDKKVQNIESVKTDWGEWKPGNDHSKWCVAENKPWTCIADVNRAKSQYERRGGALCIEDENIQKIFKGFVKEVEKCPGPSSPKRPRVSSCPDSDSD